MENKIQHPLTKGDTIKWQFKHQSSEDGFYVGVIIDYAEKSEELTYVVSFGVNKYNVSHDEVIGLKIGERFLSVEKMKTIKNSNMGNKHPFIKNAIVFTEYGKGAIKEVQKLAEKENYLYTVVVNGEEKLLTKYAVFLTKEDYEKSPSYKKSEEIESIPLGQAIMEDLSKLDMVNHPQHYGGKDNPMEAIKIIDHYKLGFTLGNTIKYILRADKKANKLEDLKKAAWYLQHEITKLENV